MAINTVNAKIAELLMWKLSTLVLSPVYPIAWPNEEFNPPIGKRYLQPTFLPNRTQSVGLDSGSSDDYTGLFQVSVFGPTQPDFPGIIGIVDVAGAVVEHFPKFVPIFRNGIKVVVSNKPWATEPMDLSDRNMVAVTVPYRAFV